MAIRIVGVDLPQNKRGEIALTYIFGIGRSSAAKILDKAGSVALLAMAKASKGEFVSADDSAPVYLRLSQAERERLEKDK